MYRCPFFIILGESFIFNNSFLTNLRVDRRDLEALINLKTMKKETLLAITWCGVFISIVYLSLLELKQPEKEKDYLIETAEIYYR